MARIVYTMSPEEIKKIMTDELPEIKRRVYAKRRGMIKEAIKRGEFPYNYIQSTVLKSGNRYYVYVIIPSMEFAMRENSMSATFIVVEERFGRSIYELSNNDDLTKVLVRYSPHFWKRVQERLKVPSSSVTDLITAFMGHTIATRNVAVPHDDSYSIFSITDTGIAILEGNRAFLNAKTFIDRDGLNTYKHGIYRKYLPDSMSIDDAEEFVKYEHQVLKNNYYNEQLFHITHP